MLVSIEDNCELILLIVVNFSNENNIIVQWEELV